MHGCRGPRIAVLEVELVAVLNSGQQCGVKQKGCETSVWAIVTSCGDLCGSTRHVRDTVFFSHQRVVQGSSNARVSLSSCTPGRRPLRVCAALWQHFGCTVAVTIEKCSPISPPRVSKGSRNHNNCHMRSNCFCFADGPHDDTSPLRRRSTI